MTELRSKRTHRHNVGLDTPEVRCDAYTSTVEEAMSMEQLRRGLAQIDLEDTLSQHDVDIEQIVSALDLDSVNEAKAAIAEVLRALRTTSEGGFPVGNEIDLAELVGFTD
jgi:hypothetical protein